MKENINKENGLNIKLLKLISDNGKEDICAKRCLHMLIENYQKRNKRKVFVDISLDHNCFMTVEKINL